MTATLFILYAASCAFWWRVRGGAWETLLHLPPKGQLARAACTGAMTLPLMLADWHAAALWPALFLGLICCGWGDNFNIPEAPLRNTIAMSLWGCVLMAPSAVVCFLLGFSVLPLLLVPLTMGPVYYACWYAPKLPSIPNFASGPTEWAEVLVGWFIGCAYWLAVV